MKLLNNPNNSTNYICNEITESICKCCIKNEHTKPLDLKEPHQKNCASENFKAIANAHYVQYIQGY